MLKKILIIIILSILWFLAVAIKLDGKVLSLYPKVYAEESIQSNSKFYIQEGDPVGREAIKAANVVLTREQIKNLVSQYPDWDTNIAVAIILAESGGNREVVNWRDNHKVCVGSYGLAQIGCAHVSDPEKLKDAEYNIEVAYSLYKKCGWKIWGAYTDKNYLKYMI